MPVVNDSGADMPACDVGGCAPLARPVPSVVTKEAHEGNWVDGKPHGRGAWTCSDGSLYVGLFKANLFDGIGIPRDMGTYLGQWTDDKRNGIGTRILPNGVCYSGKWRDNQPHSLGALTPTGEPDDARSWRY
ncbi:membrance occupation and recognition nexus protein 1, putative [Acanthamoeba castellanii str. Neff]|uniref:Membrance occupation and recognition nexus protein 1, putative n=1 Tax=Acanthamoeba castellanii (strain ATCC 30010 / Neff) TaxID=1257118 RepID=L8GQG5_ACACF|nr:membrance occupation and recognition nexus protein 1, putative [Acanthamoeba castellanii str. Neff]ELR14376.1 membrance occupation and recognition nexus protein 1, putative [Acanthamoeba castellanii str. Neff]